LTGENLGGGERFFGFGDFDLFLGLGDLPANYLRKEENVV
jgi:hypothetical protein